MRPSPVVLLSVALLPIAVAARNAGAQVVRGTVRDTLAAQPVASAAVLLEDSAGKERRNTFADSLGRFVLKVPRAGRYRVWVLSLGYESSTPREVVLGARDTANLAFFLYPHPVEVRGITAQARYQNQVRADYGERSKWGFGSFLGPADMQRFRVTTPAQLAGHLPYVSLQVTPAGPGLFMSRAVKLSCPLAVWVDGHYIPQAVSPMAPRPGLAPDELPAGAEWLPPMENVRAVEFYKEEEWAPIQYQRATIPFDRGKTCGILLLWTRSSYGD